jgi:hypothetical protein
MISSLSARLSLLAGLSATLALVGGCATQGRGAPATITAANAPAAERAYYLALECRTNEALADNEAAGRAGGAASQLAAVERVIILTEAGRPASAAGARDAIVSKLGDDNARIAELDRMVAQGTEKLRAERNTRTGKAGC